MPATSRFASILFPPEDADLPLAETEPDYFSDLNLDQLVVQLCRERSLERLQPLFWTRLPSVEAVRYRQDAIAEIEEPQIAALVARFVDRFRRAAQQLGLRRQVRYAWQQRRCLLDAATEYCQAVTDLSADLEGVQPRSEGLGGLGDFVAGYADSAGFDRLRSDVAETQQQLASVTYLLHIRGNKAHVLVPNDEADLGAEVADLFLRFHDMDVETEPVVYRRPGGFSHIDAAILDHVADLFPDQFATLSRFDAEHQNFVHPTVGRLARELEFVLACLDFKARMDQAGLPMCYPDVTTDPDSKLEGGYDAALASSPAVEVKGPKGGRRSVIRNGFDVSGPERLIVVTGPNQGGKTTFARMFGQVHHLAALGIPVPGDRAQLGLVDGIYVLFERQEDAGSDRGKLQDDLVRMRDILSAATRDSVVVLNEMFSSTSTDDALDLARRVLDPLLERGCRGLCVTFLDELASHDPAIVSMVADVDPTDPSHRLFTVSRRPADGRAYTDSLVAKYQLTPADIKRRVLR
jgi:DNA mismatch repair protein MutS